MMLDLTREQLVTLQNGLGLALFQSFGLPDEVKYRELLSIVTKAILDTGQSHYKTPKIQK